LDEQKVWYIFSKRRLVLSVPVTADDLLPFSVKLDGEIARTLIGDALVGDRSARLFKVVVERQGEKETFFEWVDAEEGWLLRLLSQDRDWSVQYEHVVHSKQPDYYFQTPLGYRKVEAHEKQLELR
jgi:hypothetical protein